MERRREVHARGPDGLLALAQEGLLDEGRGLEPARGVAGLVDGLHLGSLVGQIAVR